MWKKGAKFNMKHQTTKARCRATGSQPLCSGLPAPLGPHLCSFCKPPPMPSGKPPLHLASFTPYPCRTAVQHSQQPAIKPPLAPHLCSFISFPCPPQAPPTLPPPSTPALLTYHLCTQLRLSSDSAQTHIALSPPCSPTHAAYASSSFSTFALGIRTKDVEASQVGHVAELLLGTVDRALLPGLHGTVDMSVSSMYLSCDVFLKGFYQ